MSKSSENKAVDTVAILERSSFRPRITAKERYDAIRALQKLDEARLADDILEHSDTYSKE